MAATKKWARPGGFAWTVAEETATKFLRPEDAKAYASEWVGGEIKVVGIRM
jgi:hypothetical protein